MSDKPLKMNRRRALGVLAAAAAVVPVTTMMGARPAIAADLPQVAESDPIAVGLKYKHDATEAPRADKAGMSADKQFCSNCQFAQAEGDWIPCSIFPGKAVNAKGWCSAWVPKAG
jgi:hypothetical protein